MNHKKLWPILSFAILVACDPYEKAVEKIDTDHQKAMDILDHAGDGNPYLDKIQDPIESEKDQSPAWLDEHISLVIDNAHFKYIVEELTEDKDLNILFKEGIDSSKKISLKFSGTVREALDYVADVADYGYQIEGNMITWSPLIVETFDVNFLPADTHFTMGSGTIGSANTSTTGTGGTTGTTGVSGTTGTTSSSGGITQAGTSILTSKGDLWKEIEEGVKELLSPEGKMKLSKAMTMITVRDHPSNIKMVRQYLNHLNKSLGSQVMIKIMILDVTLNEEFKFGIDWTMIANNIAGTNNTLNFNLPTFDPTSTVIGSSAWRNATTGTGVMATMSNGSLKGTKAFLSALEGQGNVSIVTEPVTVTMNNQVAELNIVTDQVYIASTASNVTVSNGTQNTSSSATPGVITTGLSLYLLPKIFEGGVYLQINAIMSALNGEITTIDVGNGATVGTPKTSSKKFNQRSVVKNGETLIISGFKENTTNAGKGSTFGFDLLGNKSSSDNKREIIMLITPYVITPAPDVKGGSILASGNIEKKSFLSKEAHYIKTALKNAAGTVERFAGDVIGKVEAAGKDVASEAKVVAKSVASEAKTVGKAALADAKILGKDAVAGAKILGKDAKVAEKDAVAGAKILEKDTKDDAKTAAKDISSHVKAIGSDIKQEATKAEKDIQKWI